MQDILAYARGTAADKDVLHHVIQVDQLPGRHMMARQSRVRAGHLGPGIDNAAAASVEMF